MSTWAAWVREGDCVVDVGANVGKYAQAFAKAVGPRGVVMAFEPDPVSAQECRDRCPSWVTVREEAVGERCDPVAAMVWSKTRTQHSRFAGNVNDGTAGHVPMVTLDAVCEDLPVTGIKVDAQGGDGWVLEGARETLARMPAGGWVLVELWPAGYRAAGYDPVRMGEMFAGWSLKGNGKDFMETTQPLASLLADAATWDGAKHTNLWLRKD